MKFVLVIAAALSLVACNDVQQSAENIVRSEMTEVTDKVADSQLDRLVGNDEELKKLLAAARKDGRVTADERQAIIDAAAADAVGDTIETVIPDMP